MLMNRREFLKTIGIGGGSIALTPHVIGQVLAEAPRGSFLPAIENRDPVYHLLNRITFGPTDDLVDYVQQIGVDAFIEAQLKPETLDDSGIERYVGDFEILAMSSRELIQNYQENRFNIAYQLQANYLFRAFYSTRQLYEHMVHFWTDHFNVFLLNGPGLFLKVADDRDVIRRHALGRFRDILGASAHSPAMLFYLDNNESDKAHPNENYARELLELHTLGVNGGYTEDDVKEVARCFTGWTILNPRQARRPNTEVGFLFDPAKHDNGEKRVLGQIIPTNGGEKDGELVLDILATHPSTARFVSTKLVRRFVADTPPESLVERCTEVFLQQDGDMRSVLRTILTADEFWSAPPKFKRPIEYVASVVRMMNYELNNPTAFFRGGLRPFLENMGHQPFLRPSPDGYPDKQADWSDNLLSRWNAAIAASGGDLPGASGSLRPLLEKHNIPLEAEPIIRFIGQYLYGRDLSNDEVNILTTFFDVAGTEVEAIQAAIALLMAAPAFQYR